MQAPTPLRPVNPSPKVVPASPTPSPSPPTPLLRRRPRLPGGPLGLGLALGVVALAGTGLWWGQRRGALRDVTPFTVEARSGSLPGVVTATGELDAVKRVNVSPRRQGLLEALYVDEGDTVRAGQPLARMDAGDLADRQQELVANLRSAQAELARSASELARNEPLYRQGAISLDELNRYRTDFEVKRMGVAAARQRVEQRSVEGSELIVRAPFDGVISQRFADPGSFVTPTTTASASAGATSSSIVELAQGLEVLAKVPESDLGRLRLGMPATVRFDAFPDRRFAARIRQIAPRAVKTNNVTSFEVKLALDDPGPDLRIGMNADIDFQTGRLQADTLVPTVAVVTEKGRPGVLLVGKDRQPTFQAVELGVSSGRDTQILSGVKAGTRVFIDLPPWAKKRERS
ncbi:MAG: efflux RND transporter periplasmic adaptor subunit [Cyanobacteriota bacterium]|nr:efflux RND transporter periplasmic adaptor subunit [Cyanobacteriota bacterium]